MQRVNGVILDVDGTLVDSNDAHAHAWVEAMSEAGIDVAFSKVRRLIGMGGDKLLPASCGFETDSPEGKTIGLRRQGIFRTRHLPHVQPFPHAEQLLQQMHGDGLKLAVASSATAGELQALLRICGGDKYIESTTPSRETESSTLDSDVVQSALRCLALVHNEVCMLGDTPYDIGAAHKAGVRIVALRCGGWSDANLANAIAVYEHPADLLAHYSSSPFALGFED
jgi:phosphoglycolate phosphatase-like HAD superfamily hydrolase